MKHINLFLFLLLCISTSGFSQTNLDSLYAVWQDQTQPDSTRADAYKDYLWKGFIYSNPDSAILLAQDLLTYGEQHKYPKASAIAYNIMGVSSRIKSDYSEALDYYQRNLKIRHEIGDKNGGAAALNNIGLIFKMQGDYPKALDYYQRSLKISEEIGDKRGSAIIMNNIGLIFKTQGDHPKALDYYQRSLKIKQEIGNKNGIATSLGNIGLIYEAQGDYAKALDYYQRSLKIKQEIGNKAGSIANALINIGNIYQMQGDYSKALDHYQRSLKINQEIGDKRGIGIATNNIGTIHKEQGDYPKALEYCKKALIFSEEIGALDKEKDACQCLFDTYKAMEKGNEALVYLEKIQMIDDSLKTEETYKKLQRMEFGKLVLADSIANAKKERLVQEAHIEEIAQKNRTRNILIASGLLTLLISGGLFGRVRFIRNAKNRIEEKNQRMSNELNVAKDIQMSMLPLIFPAFPKREEIEIYAELIPAREVGGDFYDFHFIDENHLCFVMADVSGKGVPAALMMAVTKTLLKSRASNDKSPASILTDVNNEIAKDNDSYMFITVFLAILNTNTGELIYSNAGHNPSYIICKETKELTKLGDLHGPVIGAMEGMTYGETKLFLNKNDIVFSYTDGVTESHNIKEELYSDPRLEELLENGNYDSSKALTKLVIQSVNEFAGEAEQFDDITAMAIEYLHNPNTISSVMSSIKIINDLKQITAAIEWFEVFALENKIPFAIIQKINIALDEILNNIISYGYKDKEVHEIEVGIELRSARLIIIINDDGMPFNPFKNDPPDTMLSVEERMIGGLGIHLVKKLMDEYEYKRHINKNIITLIKHNINT